MKSLLKSSFFVIFLTIFANISLTNAVAKNAKAPKANKIEIEIFLAHKYNTKSTIKFAFNPLINIKSFTNLIVDCDGGGYYKLDNGYTCIITSDCKFGYLFNPDGELIHVISYAEVSSN